MKVFPPNPGMQMRPGHKTEVRRFVTPSAVHPMLFRNKCSNSSDAIRRHYASDDMPPAVVYAPHFDAQGEPLSQRQIERHTRYMSERIQTPQGSIVFQTSDHRPHASKFEPGTAHINSVMQMFYNIPSSKYRLHPRKNYH